MCKLSHWRHVPLTSLKNLCRRSRFVARYAFPLHQHRGVGYVCLPSEEALSAALKAYDKQRFHLLPPCAEVLPFVDQLRLTSEAVLACPTLGKPLPLEKVVEELDQPTLPLPIPLIPPVGHAPATDVLVDSRVPTVFTSTGWRPLVGGFRFCLANWHRHHSQMAPRVPAIITTGAWLIWESTPPPPLWLQNRSLSPAHEAYVNAEVQDLLRTGALRPYDVSLYGPPMFIGPLFVAEDSSGCLRLIYDPRYVNAYLRIPAIRLEQLSLLAMMLRQSDLLMKLDLKSGYHHITMAEWCAPFLCCRWGGQVLWWYALPFGLATSPAIFELVMRALTAIMRRLLHLNVMRFLDDFNFCFPPQPNMTVPVLFQQLHDGDDLPQIHAISFLLAMGAALHVRKFQCGQVVVMIGTEVDSDQMEFRVPQEKWHRLVPLLEATGAKSQQSVHSLASLAGTFVSMANGLRHACTFLWSIYNLVRPFVAQGAFSKQVQVPPRIRSRCQWWIQRFPDMNGIPLRQQRDFLLCIDASKKGSGGVLQGSGILELTHMDRPLEEQSGHNGAWELLSSADAVIPVLHLIQGSNIEIQVDNMLSRAYLRKGGGRQPHFTLFSETFHDMLIEHNVNLLRVNHLPGILNVGPDALSRFQDVKGDWHMKPHVVQLVVRWIHQLGLPMFTLDCFASSLNSLCQNFCSRFWEVGSTYCNFFTAPIPAEQWVMWVNPPFSLLSAVLLKFMQCGFTGYLVAPQRLMDQAAPWWIPLLTHSRASLVLPDDAFTSILTAHTAGFHPVGYPIAVHFLSFVPPHRTHRAQGQGEHPEQL